MTSFQVRVTLEALVHPWLLWLIGLGRYRKRVILAINDFVVLSLALAIFPAYALSRFRFRGMGLVGFGLFITQMLPEAMLVVPLYAIFGDLALLNTLGGLILANSAFTVPVITWILKGAVDGVPIGVVAGLAEHRHRAIGLVVPHHPVVGDVRPNQVAAGCEVGRTLRPAGPRPKHLEMHVGERHTEKPFVEDGIWGTRNQLTTFWPRP